MTDVPCAVCGHGVHVDSDHVRVEVQTVRLDDRDEIDEYYLHVRCRDAVFSGWWEP